MNIADVIRDTWEKRGREVFPKRKARILEVAADIPAAVDDWTQAETSARVQFYESPTQLFDGKTVVEARLVSGPVYFQAD